MNNSEKKRVIYQISNNSINNTILIYKVMDNGNLNYFGFKLTGGCGSSLNHTNSLFSQNPIIVFKKFLFAVNSGSNSFSLFKINSKDPTDIQLLKIIDSCGDYPVSIAVNKRIVAILNGGEKSNLVGFKWNKSGKIEIKPSFIRDILLNPQQTTPPKGLYNTVSDILFSSDNKCIIISYKGTSKSNPGGLLIYTVKKDKVSEKPIYNILQGGCLSFGMKKSGKNGLIITNASNGVYFIVYDSSTGQTNSFYPDFLPINGAVCWIAHSKKTKHYYIISTITSQITEIKINKKNSLEIINTYLLPEDSLPSDANIAKIGNLELLFVNSPGTKSINVILIKSSGIIMKIHNVKYPTNYSSKKIIGMAIK